MSERQRPAKLDLDTPHKRRDGRAASAVALWLALSLSGCATAMSTAQLENTYWKLLRADGVAAVVEDGEREPHFVLHPARAALAGHTGCNRLTLGYTLTGAALAFARPAPVPAACQRGAATRQQARMLQALGRTAHWRVVGEQLELLDSAGLVLASFESVYLR